MATLGANYLTLADWAKRVDPDGQTAQVVELLNQTNEILDDMLVTEGNLTTGHRTTVRTGLPSVVWRKLNYGVQPSKSHTAQVDDTCGLCEARSVVDEELANLNGNSASFLLSEQLPFLEKMNQEMAGGLFYFDTDTDPEKFLGLASRYPTLATSNVVNAGGSGSDVTSVWLIGWGPNTVHGIFPKGMMAGLEQKYKGLEPVADSQSPAGTYYAHVTQWKWRLGLCVRDWRYIVRIANIETSGNSNILTTDLMLDALGKLPSRRIMGPGRFAWYMNSTIWTQLTKEAMNKTNVNLTVSEVENGGMITKFLGVPLRQVDQILSTEDALT